MRTLHGSIRMQIDGSGAKDFYRDLRVGVKSTSLTRDNAKTSRLP